ncbi:MAG: 50S ribosomal protein L13 [Halobacteriota archaeon]
MTVIDANGLILGRLASIVAHRLLSGEEIDIINAERTVVSGSPDTTVSKYQTMRKKGSKEKGPYFPKRSDMILRRTIRGMLPYKKAFGKAAFGRLRVYMGTPTELSNVDAETLDSAHKSRLSTIKVTDLEKISQRLGAKKQGETIGEKNN